jgi:hypothetical protein
MYAERRHTYANRRSAVNIYNTPEQALAAIPALLNAGNPGISQPASIVIGGGFSDADFDTIKLACKDKRRVPWFKADRSHFASMPPLSEPEAFGAKAAVRIKARLLELQVGQNTRESDEVFLF